MPRFIDEAFFIGLRISDGLPDRNSKASTDGFPPYNVECIRNENDQIVQFRLVLAVAGFARDELEIILEDNQLSITGEQTPDTERHYLHKGIAARKFTRNFMLADGLTIQSAELDNGLLAIIVARPVMSKRTERIEIKTS